MPKRKKIVLKGTPKPRHVSEREFSLLLSKMTSERNIMVDNHMRNYKPLVMKPFFRDYISGMLNMAIEKSAVVDTTKANLGSIHVLQYQSKNSAEWDRKNGLIDCSIVLTHKYGYAEVKFGDSFKEKALQALKNGREYLKKNYNWLN